MSRYLPVVALAVVVLSVRAPGAEIRTADGLAMTLAGEVRGQPLLGRPAQAGEDDEGQQQATARGPVTHSCSFATRRAMSCLAGGWTGRAAAGSLGRRAGLPVGRDFGTAGHRRRGPERKTAGFLPHCPTPLMVRKATNREDRYAMIRTVTAQRKSTGRVGVRQLKRYLAGAQRSVVRKAGKRTIRNTEEG